MRPVSFWKRYSIQKHAGDTQRLTNASADDCWPLSQQRGLWKKNITWNSIVHRITTAFCQDVSLFYLEIFDSCFFCRNEISYTFIHQRASCYISNKKWPKWPKKAVSESIVLHSWMVQYMKLALNNTLLITKGRMLHNTMRESLFYCQSSLVWRLLYPGWCTRDDQNKAPRYQKETVLKIRAEHPNKRQWIISQDWYNVSTLKNHQSYVGLNLIARLQRNVRPLAPLKSKIKRKLAFMFKEFPMNTFKWSCRVKVRGHKYQMNRNICKF